MPAQIVSGGYRVRLKPDNLCQNVCEGRVVRATTNSIWFYPLRQEFIVSIRVDEASTIEHANHRHSYAKRLMIGGTIGVAT